MKQVSSKKKNTTFIELLIPPQKVYLLFNHLIFVEKMYVSGYVI